MKARPLYAAVCLSLLFVAGCSQAPTPVQPGQSGASSSEPELPALNPVDEVRDQVSRAESAIITASGYMTELATDCADCRAALEQVKTDASTRLGVSGGRWEPWPNASPEALENLPAPAQVGEAPHTPAGLVGYMFQTSLDQLDALVNTPDVPAEDTLVLTSVLAGRMVAAQNIAYTYGLSTSESVAALPAGAAWTTVGVPAAQATAPTAVDQVPPTPQSGDTDSPWQTDPQAAEALVAYDCIGTSLGFSDLITSDFTAEESLNIRLLDRVTVLTKLGVPDGRGVRCVFEDQATDALLQSLVATDLSFMSSDRAEVRTVAAGYLIEDLTVWISLGTPDTVSPGLTVTADTSSTDSLGTDQNGENS